MDLPSTEAWIDEGWTWETWTADVGAYAAETVEQQGRSGAAIQVTDNREAIDAALADRNGCGCDGTGGAGVGVAGLALIALRRRARR
jgi:MYXO-CTERM domain-containing protein